MIMVTSINYSTVMTSIMLEMNLCIDTLIPNDSRHDAILDPRLTGCCWTNCR